MNDVPFYRTQMGSRYYGHSLPELTRNVGRVADALERLLLALEQAAPKPAPSACGPSLGSAAR